MSGNLPALNGKQLMKLLEKDGLVCRGKCRHGYSYSKLDPSGRNLVTVIQVHSDTMPKGTLAAILSVKQTCLGRAGLEALIKKYGLPSR